MGQRVTEEKAARDCGMTVKQWRQARGRVRDAKSRGQRAGDAVKKLESWGPVDGQPHCR
jgi:hypothetical protein